MTTDRPKPRRYVGPPIKGTGRRERITVLLDPELINWLAVICGPRERNDAINRMLFAAKNEAADAPSR
jgi:hypothetical protein